MHAYLPTGVGRDAYPLPWAETFPWATLLGSALLGVILQWFLSYTYAGLIVETFGGARNAHIVSGGAILLSYLVTAAATAAAGWYCITRTGPSRIVVMIHLIAVIIPVQALVAADFELAHAEFATAVGGGFVLSVLLAGNLVDISLGAVTSRGRVLGALAFVLITLYVYASLVTHGGLGRLNFDLSLVYEVREEFLEDAAPFAGYLIPWQGYVVNPVLLLIGLRRRSVLLISIALALQAALFAMTGFRAFLFSPVLMVTLYRLGVRRRIVALALCGAMAIIVIARLIYVVTNEPLVPSLLVYRLLFIPAELHFWYYDFFGIHGQPLLLLSQSALSAFSPQHYGAPIADVIGWQYMGSNASANVGLFGDAFANFGFAGCAIYALLFAVVLKAMDAAGRLTPPRIAAGLVSVPAFQLVNSGLLTTLATHGLALTIIALWLLGDRRNETRGPTRSTA